MRNESRAVFELPGGAQFTLMLDGSWQFGEGVPQAIKELVGYMDSWVYMDPILQDHKPYIEAVSEATGASVIAITPNDIPPPDAVF